MPTYSFEVPFVRGKGRVRFARATGRTYTPDATAEAMQIIRQEWGGRAGAPAGTPVSVRILTMRPMPKSRPKKMESEPDVYKPDCDNIAKLVLDALNGIAWVDDTQVTVLNVFKCDRTRSISERTCVEVEWEEGNDGA